MTELTADLRTQIEAILRASSPGLTHGVVFRGLQRGLSVEQIAAEHGTSVGNIRTFRTSLQHLLDGTVPAGKSAAQTNSYVYKELLNHHLSPQLEDYVHGRLRQLAAINPAVTLGPLRTRPHPYAAGRRTSPAIPPAGECEAAPGAPSSTLTVATWNTAWATLSSRTGPRVAGRLRDTGADVIVVTEGTAELLPAGGHLVDAGSDWGYRTVNPLRRKVIVWSRFPLTVQTVGAAGATRGRLVVTSVATPAGPVRVIGVCIPWRDAHVATGRCDARAWSEHLDFLDRLEELLGGLDPGVPTVIAGDFNQRIPRVRQPVRVAERLGQVFAGWTVHTGGEHAHGPHIDHIATNAGWGCGAVTDWAGRDAAGRLSDHAGVSCQLVLGPNAG